MKRHDRTSGTGMYTSARLITLSLLLALGASTGKASDPPSASEAEKRAKEAFIQGTFLQLQGGRHAEAILEFQESLRYSVQPVTLTAMARSFLELGKLERAEESVNEALKLDRTYRDAWEVLSEVLISSGRYDEGLEAYEHVVQLQPSRRQLYTLARLYEPRNAKRAAELYEMCVAIQPDADTYCRLASLYKRTRSDAQCIIALEKAYKLDNGNHRIQADLLEEYVALGRIPDAIEIAMNNRSGSRNAINTEDMWGYLLTAIALDSMVTANYANDIVSVLDKTVERYPHSFGLLMPAGDLALRVNEIGRADRLFDAAIATAPANVLDEVYIRIGASYLTNNYPDLALQFTIVHQPSFPKDFRFLALMGDASVALKQTNDAITYYQAALELDPSLVDVWILLGIQADNAGQTEESDRAYRRALQLDPSNIVASNNFAYTLAVRKIALDTAQQLAMQAVEQQPSNPAYLDTYAWVLYQKGDASRAKFYAEQAVKLEGNATHYEHLGLILEQIGETERAVTCWNKALELDPERSYLKHKIANYR